MNRCSLNSWNFLLECISWPCYETFICCIGGVHMQPIIRHSGLCSNHNIVVVHHRRWFVLVTLYYYKKWTKYNSCITTVVVKIRILEKWTMCNFVEHINCPCLPVFVASGDFEKLETWYLSELVLSWARSLWYLQCCEGTIFHFCDMASKTCKRIYG